MFTVIEVIAAVPFQVAAILVNGDDVAQVFQVFIIRFCVRFGSRNSNEERAKLRRLDYQDGALYDYEQCLNPCSTRVVLSSRQFCMPA